MKELMNAIDKKIEPDNTSRTWWNTWLWKFQNRGEEWRKEKSKEDSKHARRVKAELNKRRRRVFSILLVGTIGASISASVLWMWRYISITVDKTLLKSDIDGMDTNSWKRKWLSAIHYAVDFLVPDYEMYGRLDDYFELVNIPTQDIEKIGIYLNPLEVKVIQPQIKVDQYGALYVIFRVCDVNCTGNPQTLDTIQTRKIWKIEKGRLFFYKNVNITWEQRTYIAQKLLKKGD